MVQDHLAWASLGRRVKDDSEFAILLSNSLGGGSAPWGKMHHPRFERQDVTISFFLVHHFRGHFWVHAEGFLVASSQDYVFVFIFFFEIKVRRASLFDDPRDVIRVFVAEER